MTKPVMFEFAVPYFEDERLMWRSVPWVVGQLAHHHWKTGEPMPFDAFLAHPKAGDPADIREGLARLIETGYVTETAPDVFELGSDHWRISDEPPRGPFRLGRP